jgi:putative membrane protein
MSPKLKKFLASWIINTAAVAVAASIVHGIHYGTVVDLLVASFVLGLLNAFIRPILMLMALPLLIFTLGLFVLVINAVLLWAVGQLMTPYFSIDFSVDGFRSAFWGAVVIGIISLVLNSLTGSGGSRVEFRRGRRPDDSDHRGGGNGPVIDV